MAIVSVPAVSSRRAWRVRIILLTTAAIWIVGIALGLRAMAQYEFTAGRPATAGIRWPIASHLPRIAGRSTLVMLAHPQCFCTRASLEELAKLMARTSEHPLTVFVLFVQPDGLENSLVASDIQPSAAAISGVTVITDRGGVEATNFGAATSGQVLVFNPAGQMTFSGGITAYRSHIGDNDGRSAIEALLSGKTPAQHNTPVFGCPLFNERP